MNIPQVNANVTDRNRTQSRRICGLKDYAYHPAHELDIEYKQGSSALAWRGPGDNRCLPNGSFTLDQVVGMLDDLKIVYFGGGRDYNSGWEPAESMDDEPMLQSDDPHDLTAAMDALIKALEAKL